MPIFHSSMYSRRPGTLAGYMDALRKKQAGELVVNAAPQLDPCVKSTVKTSPEPRRKPKSKKRTRSRYEVNSYDKLFREFDEIERETSKKTESVLEAVDAMRDRRLALIAKVR